MLTTHPAMPGVPTVPAPLRPASALPPPPAVPYEFNYCLRFNSYEPALDPLRFLFPLRPFNEID
jgi:hypothetical protein